MRVANHIRNICLIGLFISLVAAPVYAEIELRTLIDVSGSMKQTDPDNLRKPALRLLVRLLPKGAHAGVWTFAQQVNQNLPPTAVNDSWRKEAKRVTEQIHSRGLFTDIELAIKTATQNWQGADDSNMRNLILLTDGVVDVDKDSTLSDASRLRILEQQIPVLREKGIRVLAVALSEHADHELLQQLALATDGWYELASNADQLQRVFLRLFEMAAAPDSVPLDDNRFQIDKSINEMTLVVFHKPDSAETAIVQPDGTEITELNKSSAVHWVSENGYEMITIAEPLAGDWQIMAEVDPDDRVLVVTNLKLKVSPIKKQAAPGLHLAINAELKNNGERIKKTSFLSLVSMFVEQHLPDGSRQTHLFSLNDEYEYIAELESLSQEGEHKFIVTAKSDTFIRTSTYKMNLLSPVAIQVQADAVAGTGTDYLLKVIPRNNLVDATTMQLSGEITHDSGIKKNVLLSQGVDANWTAKIAADLPGEYALRVNVTGLSLYGDLVQSQSQPFVLSGPEAVLGIDETGAGVTGADEPEGMDMQAWVTAAWQTALVNILIFGAGWGAYRWFRSRQNSDDLNLIEADT